MYNVKESTAKVRYKKNARESKVCIKESKSNIHQNDKKLGEKYPLEIDYAMRIFTN
jgi:hypothetical protein